jgi:hypothetical protein
VGHGLHFAAVLHPALGSVGDDEDLLALLGRPGQQPVRALVEFVEEGLGFRANVKELEGGEVGGAEDGVVPVEDEDCVGWNVLCWFFLRGRSGCSCWAGIMSLER